jgi:hypothetical protein
MKNEKVRNLCQTRTCSRQYCSSPNKSGEPPEFGQNSLWTKASCSLPGLSKALVLRDKHLQASQPWKYHEILVNHDANIDAATLTDQHTIWSSMITSRMTPKRTAQELYVHDKTCHRIKRWSRDVNYPMGSWRLWCDSNPRVRHADLPEHSGASYYHTQSPCIEDLICRDID